MMSWLEAGWELYGYVHICHLLFHAMSVSLYVSIQQH